MDDTSATRAAVTNSQERVGCDPFAGSSEREYASSGGTHIACRASITATDVRNMDTSVEWLSHHRVKQLLVGSVLLGGLVVVSVIAHSDQDIDLPFFVGGDFDLAGDVLEQSGWLHAVRTRIAAPSNETPMCLDSTGKGRVIDFCVVSEELHIFVRPVAVAGSPTVVLTLEGVRARPKATQARQAPDDRASGPVEETPELRCGGASADRTLRCALHWTRRPCDGDTL